MSNKAIQPTLVGWLLCLITLIAAGSTAGSVLMLLPEIETEFFRKVVAALVVLPTLTVVFFGGKTLLERLEIRVLRQSGQDFETRARG